MFDTNYPGYQAADDLKLGLQLLKFLTLFSQRYTPCPTTPSPIILKEMRRRSALRVKDWLQYRKILTESRGFGSPLSLPELQRNRQAILAHKAANLRVEEAEFFGTPSSVSLLDLLPIFMSLSAAKVHQANWKINGTWMSLAADFMQRAALEQFWVFGTQQIEPIGAAFAWGWTDHEASQSDPSSESHMVNEMFQDEDTKMEIPEWTLIRSEHIKALLPTKAYPETQDICALSQFEGTMISFLEGMLKSLRQPVLVQMEVGKVEGMSDAETSTFKTRLGWG
jgi:hypothetical protein